MRIIWLDTFEVEVIDQYDKKTDNITESHNEVMQDETTNEIDIIKEDGDYVDIQFGDGSMIIGLLRDAFAEITGDKEEPKTFKKVTEGCVIQTYKILSNGTKVCIAQEFKAGDTVEYEDENNVLPVFDTKENEVYCNFEMKQPKYVHDFPVNPVKDNYPDGECPDCGQEIPDDIVDGGECPNCGHVFYKE